MYDPYNAANLGRSDARPALEQRGRSDACIGGTASYDLDDDFEGVSGYFSESSAAKA